MYPRNATNPPELAIGPVIQISDGAVQTSAVSISVKAKGGAPSAGGGTTAYGTGGTVFYTPTQAETNTEEFIVEAYKTGCLPVAQTIVTTASNVAGKVDVSHINGAAQTAGDLAALIVVVDGVVDSVLARLGSWTGTGVNTVLGAFRALMAKAAALTPTDISTGTTYDNTTDSVEAIRDTAPLGTAMRGTDGAYTGTPPTAATIAAAVRDVSNAAPAAGSLGAKVNTAAAAEHAASPEAGFFTEAG